MNAADKCRQMGLKVGDKIIGSESYAGFFCEIDEIRRDFEKWHYERHQHYPTMMETNEYSTRATRDYWRAWKAGAALAVNDDDYWTHPPKEA